MTKEPTKPPFPLGRQKTEAELDWEAEGRVARDKSKHEFSVSPSCTVPQKDGPTLHAGDKVDPDRIEGGMPQVVRWMRDGYIQKTDERRLKTNRGEFEFVMKTAVTTGGQIYAPGEGFNAEELDMAGTDGSQVIGPNGTLINRPGRAPVAGTELVEDLIRRELAERARIRDKVVASVRKRLKRDAKVESAKGGA